VDFAIVPEVAKMPASGTGIDSIIRQVRKAEDLGYTGCFMPDHYVFEEIGTLRPDRPTYDAFMTLAIVAQHTKNMKLVTHVACAIFRHPAMHARLFAQIDEASGGRAIAGMGAGWTKAEFEIMGIEFPDVSERLKMMDEQIVAAVTVFFAARVVTPISFTWSRRPVSRERQPLTRSRS
jgi:alkanesulfonate monooxygenase SsuD/methylene tetrahydromethanopterin reductase-like flavin-dependent oxidoreductase (luciferase family)